MIVTIQDGQRRRFIGEYLAEKRLFRKKVRESAHLFKKLDAWGIDGQYFTDVLLPNEVAIKILDEEHGILYETDAATFHKKGQYLHFKGDADHRAQIFLSRRCFKQSELVRYYDTNEQKVKVTENQTLF